jgi:hypothetical protein
MEDYNSFYTCPLEYVRSILQLKVGLLEKSNLCNYASHNIYPLVIASIEYSSEPKIKKVNP